MAEVIGFLKDTATYGEKLTREYLKANLPNDFRVFVETPVQGNREIRYPDFIVATNYGVVVIEVKDWIQIESIDPRSCVIRTRNNDTMRKPNPVETAREMGLALEEHFRGKQLKQQLNGTPIGWGYMAVLPNLPPSMISQAKAVWGDDWVISQHELKNPDILKNKLKRTIRADRMRAFTREELDILRGVIYPMATVELANKEQIILDEPQIKIVSEDPAVEEKVEKKAVEEQKEKQISMFETSAPTFEDHTEEIEEELEKLSQKAAIRLIRGVAGSGKTLVLEQRAKFLSMQYPEWKILVLAYNDNLSRNLKAKFSEFTNIEVSTFHAKCSHLLDLKRRTYDSPKNFITRVIANYPSLRDIDPDYLEEELNWMKDNGLLDPLQYLEAKRKGRGIRVRITVEHRHAISQLMEAWNVDLASRRMLDYGDLPLLVMDGIKNGTIDSPKYDAILIDEAQDFAPVWVKTTTTFLKPERGVLFLADDPTQSIYKNYSWKEKGIPVVGHTRWLTVPYRNTYEVISLANALILKDDDLRESLLAEGLTLPDAKLLDNIRHDDKPLFVQVTGVDQEATFIDNTIKDLERKGISISDMVILYPHKRDYQKLQKHLTNRKIRADSIHSFKGLEAEVVFIIAANGAFEDDDRDSETMEKRVYYMGFTRSRRKLYVSYTRSLPKQLAELNDHYDQIVY